MSATIICLRSHRVASALTVNPEWSYREAYSFALSLEHLPTSERIAVLVDRGMSRPSARAWLVEVGYIRRDFCAGCGQPLV